MTTEITQFLSEIKISRKSMRGKYVVTATHLPTGLKKEHEVKSLKAYTQQPLNHNDKQIKMSLWYKVNSKTRSEWIETLEDQTIKDQLYANIKVDMQMTFPTLSNAIMSSGLWSRWPEGKEYWENIVRPIVLKENGFQADLMMML